MAQIGLQKVDTDLATNGVGAFDLPKVDVEKLGGNTAEVSGSSERLMQLARKMGEFRDELGTLRSSLMDGSWTGQAADEFSAQFPKVMSAFEEIEPCIRSIAEWAQSTMNRYAAADNATANMLERILNTRS